MERHWKAQRKQRPFISLLTQSSYHSLEGIMKPVFTAMAATVSIFVFAYSAHAAEITDYSDHAVGVQVNVTTQPATVAHNANTVSSQVYSTKILNQAADSIVDVQNQPSDDLSSSTIRTSRN